MKLKLIEKKNLEGSIWSFTFQPQKSLLWKAGQQMCFRLDHPNPDNLGTERVFTLATAPFEKNITILTHCDEQCSTFKKALKNMGIGDWVKVGKPFGDFTITDPNKQYTFIAAGVGIAPFRAILMDLDYHDQPIHATLIYSHITERFPYNDELDELLERNTGLSIFYNIDPKQIERGRIKEILSGIADNPIYMSGVYIRKIATMLDHRDVSPRRVVHDGRTVVKKVGQWNAKDEQELFDDLVTISRSSR